MNAKRICIAIRGIASAIVLTVVFDMPRVATADSRPSASEAIRGALDNARHRYNQALDYYGLTELYYGETRGVCALKLDMPGRMGEPLSILYERAYNTIQYSQVIPKGLAQQLINDRMLIDSYQRVLRTDEANKNRLTSEQAREWREFRRANPELSLAHAISKFSMQKDVSKNKLRNFIGEEKKVDDMTEEEYVEYKKGDKYKVQKENEQIIEQRRKAEQEREKEQVKMKERKEQLEKQRAERHAKWLAIANAASRDEVLATLRDKGDADYFFELKRKKEQGKTLDEREERAWDNLVDRIGKSYFRSVEFPRMSRTRSRNVRSDEGDEQQGNNRARNQIRRREEVSP